MDTGGGAITGERWRHKFFYAKAMVDLLEYSLENGWHTVAEKVIAWMPLPEPYRPPVRAEAGQPSGDYADNDTLMPGA